MASLVVCTTLFAQPRGSASSRRPPDEPNITIPKRVRVSSAVAGALLVKKVAPQYPEVARRDRIQGTVMLRAVISKTGDVAELQVISGEPVLAEAAINAVRQWKYKRYLLQGEPVEVETQVQVNFALSNK